MRDGPSEPPGTSSLEGNHLKTGASGFKSSTYLITSGTAEKSEKVKCATFLHVVGDDVIKVHNTFQFDDLEVFKDLRASRNPDAPEIFVLHKSTRE